MSKFWFTAVVLGLTCTPAVAKDKDKGSSDKPSRGTPSTSRPAERSQPQKSAPTASPKPVAPAPTPKPSTPRQTERSQPQKSAPALSPKPAAPTPSPTAPRQSERSQSQKPASTSLPKPAPATAPNPDPLPKPIPAPASAQKPALFEKPARSPVVDLAPRKSDAPKKAEDSHKSDDSHAKDHSPPSQHPASEKAATKQDTKTAPASPAGKIGTAIGPLPAPDTPIVGQPFRATPEKPAERSPTASKQSNRGNSSTPLFPTAPKFETNKKIPPFGAPLTGRTPNNDATHKHDHDGAKPVAGNQRPSITPKPAQKPIPNHDHRHDDHNHNHSVSSNRRSWSLLILGGAAPLGGGWRGPGYGRTYGGWNNDVYYVPAQSYVPLANVPVAVPAPVNASALPQSTRPSYEDFSTLPIARQRELLLQALNALEDDFARSPNGDDWSRQLQLATTAKLIGEGDEPTDPVTRTRLRSVVELFDEVAANADYRPVSELLSFRSLQAGLREFASEPIGQARGRLSRTADLLSQQFKTWPNGERWDDYLQIAWLVGTEEEEQLELPERLIRFEKLLAKFDRIKSDEQFQVVSKEPTFTATHVALQVFVQELRLLIEANTPKPQEIEQP